MKHLFNNLSSEEKKQILEQHKGGIKIDTSRFNKLIESKLGDVKPLLNEQAVVDPTRVGSTRTMDLLPTNVDNIVRMLRDLNFMVKRVGNQVTTNFMGTLNDLQTQHNNRFRGPGPGPKPKPTKTTQPPAGNNITGPTPTKSSPLTVGKKILLYTEPNDGGNYYGFIITKGLTNYHAGEYTFEAKLASEKHKDAIEAITKFTVDCSSKDDSLSVSEEKSAVKVKTLYNKSFYDAFRKEYCTQNDRGDWVPQADYTKSDSEDDFNIA